MKKGYKLLIIVLMIILLCAISGTYLGLKESRKSDRPSENQNQTEKGNKEENKEGQEKTDQKEENTGTESGTEWEEQMIKNMSLEDKVAQMFVVFLDSFAEKDQVTTMESDLKQKFSDYPVGGILMMSDNVANPDQMIDLNSQIKKIYYERTGVNPFICVDEEGGTVSRIAKNEAFQVNDVGNMSDIGATGDTDNAYQTGIQLGTYLKKYQFNVDFAPDADVLVNPENEVIGKRSFGSDGNLVSEMVVQEMKGLHEEQICTAVKHFPGHGATEEDSHQEVAYSNRTLEQIRECELLPFQSAIQEGTEFVMVGHISYPNITGNDEPASLSEYMITDLLRNELSYDGIVITDAMNMGAISQNYGSGEATLKAVRAGADIILEPSDFQESYQELLEAVQRNEISEERIDESVRRILKVKNNLK